MPARKLAGCKQWFVFLERELTLRGLLLWSLALWASDVSAKGDDCASCHEEQSNAWQSSHHALAMAPATPVTKGEAVELNPDVLGDFSEVTTSHHGLSATFRTVDGHPVMSLTRDKRTRHHLVTHSFGVTPLQQYLTETDDGHRQVLPFSWDTRPRSEGGQRWITLHPAEDIAPNDRLHWQQPLANWNGMCADCHSTGLVRNYKADTRQFTTTSTETNVGCGSCHGNQPHDANPAARGSSVGFTPRYPLPEAGDPANKPTNKNAPANTGTHNPAKRTLEICAGCHSLRTPLTDGIQPELAYLDQFAPTLINPTLYFPDGQIKEEVYVWGSFLQSRMHEEGVTCGNCHDPHSQALKAEDNALCGQCHIEEKYNARAHHRHEPATSGAQCVNCHMPSRTFMVVDDRRDHSFHVPDPERSQALGSPDPCTSCHKGKRQNWAAATIANWTAPGTIERQKRASNPSKTLWQQHQAGVVLPGEALDELLSDKTLPELLRASALSQQTRLAGSPGADLLSDAIKHQEPLITYAAANAASGLPLTQRETLLAPLLNHHFRAVRIAAANQLRDSSWAATSVDSSSATAKISATIENLKAALAEADTAGQVSAWRGEGLLNQALNAERQGDIEGAIKKYQQAIDRDPYFEPGYVNLTELYRRQGDKRREQLLYTQALKTLPNSMVLRYAYALHLVRRKQPAKALEQTTRALDIDPASQSNAYLHLLLLDNLGQTKQGIAWLRNNLEHHTQSPQVLQIGAQHAQKLQDNASLTLFATAIKSINQ